MELPAVHRCLQLSDENEQLLKKLKRLRRKNQELENDLIQIREKMHLQQFMHVTSREILQMYNKLQKCYVREIKTIQEQSEIIKNLTINIHELKHQLQGQKQIIEQLECKKVSQKDNAVSGVRTPTAETEVTISHRCLCKKGACPCRYLEVLLLEIQKLKEKNEKLSRERKMQRNELAALDKEFFDEIEDLKYALQQSIQLNDQYEKCLKCITSTYGLAFAAPFVTSNSHIT